MGTSPMLTVMPVTQPADTHRRTDGLQLSQSTYASHRRVAARQQPALFRWACLRVLAEGSEIESSPVSARRPRRDAGDDGNRAPCREAPRRGRPPRGGVRKSARTNRRLVQHRRHVGRAVRLRSPLVRRRWHRRGLHRLAGGAGARVRRRGAGRAVRRPASGGRPGDPVRTVRVVPRGARRPLSGRSVRRPSDARWWSSGTLLWPDELLVPLPESLSNDAGALLEPLGVAIHAVEHAHVRPGHDVLVVGAGPIGVLAGAVARRAGATRVFVSEPLEHRRSTALRFGADAAWAPVVVEDELMKVTAGRGVDVVVEMAGTDDAIATAVACTRPGARVALGGIPSGPRSSSPAAAARRKGLTFAMVRRMHDTYAQAVEHRDNRHRSRRPGQRPLPARAVGRGVRARRRPHRRQDRHRRVAVLGLT